MKHLKKFCNRVVGIMVTDEAGNITDGTKPIVFSAKKHIRILDQAIMNNAIRSYGQNVIGVIGSNTFKELAGTKMMDNMERTLKSFIVSSEKDILMYKKHNSEPTTLFTFGEDETKDNKKKILHAVVEAALCEGEGDQWNPYTAIILGGVSVYEAFKSHYSYIHHSVIHNIEVDEGSKKLGTISEFRNDYTDALIATEASITTYDTDEYTSTIYAHHVKQE